MDMQTITWTNGVHGRIYASSGLAEFTHLSLNPVDAVVLPFKHPSLPVDVHPCEKVIGRFFFKIKFDEIRRYRFCLVCIKRSVEEV